MSKTCFRTLECRIGKVAGDENFHDPIPVQNVHHIISFIMNRHKLHKDDKEEII